MKTIQLLPLAMLVFCVPMAHAEMFTIFGSNDSIDVMVSIEDDLNIIRADSDDTHYEYVDSEIKHYKSGGFRMANDYSLLFAHPENDGTYKVVFLTSEGVQRLEMSVIQLEESIPVEETVPEVTERIEPKSSVGADITQHTFENKTRGSGVSEHIYTIKGDYLTSMTLGDEYDRSFRVYDAKYNENLEGIPVTFEIIRDDFVHISIEEETTTGGIVRINTDNMDYPLFYPNFCYDVIVTATIGDDTAVWDDDFLMKYSGAWNPDMDWTGESRWNHLPSSFEDEPRRSLNSDEWCN